MTVVNGNIYKTKQKTSRGRLEPWLHSQKLQINCLVPILPTS